MTLSLKMLLKLLFDNFHGNKYKHKWIKQLKLFTLTIKIPLVSKKTTFLKTSDMVYDGKTNCNKGEQN